MSPALRDTITRDVAQNVSEFEPRPHDGAAESKFDSPLAELEGAFQTKAAYLLKAPKAAK